MSDFVTCHMSHVKCQPGQMAIIGLVSLLFVAVITATLFARTAGFLRFGSNDISREQAVNLAEAGVDHALWKLQTDSNYPGESTPRAVGIGEFKTTVTGDSSTKAITSTGCIPDCTSPNSKQIVKVDATNNPGSSSTIPITLNPYILQAGDQGIYNIFGSSWGPVYSNSNNTGVCSPKSAAICVIGSGSAVINGNATAVGNVCPPTPALVCSGSITGTKLGGQAPVLLPDLSSAISQFKTGAASGGIIDCSSSCGSITGNVGNREYDVKGTGRVVFGDLSGNGTNVQGPIWVTNCPNTSATCLQINTPMTIDSSIGSNGVPIVVDGNIGINLNHVPSVGSSSGGFPLIISTLNNTSTSPTCIYTQATSAPQTIFYAHDCNVQLFSSQPDSGALEVFSRGILLSSSNVNPSNQAPLSTITVSTGSSPGTWTINKGSYRYSAN